MWDFQWVKREGWEVCERDSSVIEEGWESTAMALGSSSSVFER
jgi:hypothetical protein